MPGIMNQNGEVFFNTGTLAVGALTNGTTALQTLTDANITASSFFHFFFKEGTTSAAINAACAVRVVSQTAGSASLRFTNSGSASTLSTDYILNYMVIG